MDIIYPAKVDAYVVEIQLGPDDILPGEDKVFEVYLGAAPGTYISLPLPMPMSPSQTQIFYLVCTCIARLPDSLFV